MSQGSCLSTKARHASVAPAYASICGRFYYNWFSSHSAQQALCLEAYRNGSWIMRGAPGLQMLPLAPAGSQSAAAHFKIEVVKTHGQHLHQKIPRACRFLSSRFANFRSQVLQRLCSASTDHHIARPETIPMQLDSRQDRRRPQPLCKQQLARLCPALFGCCSVSGPLREGIGNK